MREKFIIHCIREREREREKERKRERERERERERDGNEEVRKGRSQRGEGAVGGGASVFTASSPLHFFISVG